MTLPPEASMFFPWLLIITICIGRGGICSNEEVLLPVEGAVCMYFLVIRLLFLFICFTTKEVRVI